MYNHIMPYWSAFPQQTCPYYYSPYAQQPLFPMYPQPSPFQAQYYGYQTPVIPHNLFLQHAYGAQQYQSPVDTQKQKRAEKYQQWFEHYVKGLCKETAYGNARFLRSQAKEMIVLDKGMLPDGEETIIAHAHIRRDEQGNIYAHTEYHGQDPASFADLLSQVKQPQIVDYFQEETQATPTAQTPPVLPLGDDEVHVEEVEEFSQTAWDPARNIPEPAPEVLPEKLDPQSPAGRLDRAIQCALGKTQKQLEEDVHYTTDRPCKYAAAVWIADKEDQSSYNSDRHTLLFLSVGDKGSNGRITFKNKVDNARGIEQLLTEGKVIKAKDIELTQIEIAEISQNAQQI